MKRLEDRSSPPDRDTRGVSPQVGFILLLGLVLVGATLVYVVGIHSVNLAESQAYAEKTEQDLRQFDADLEGLEWQDDTPVSVHLGEQLEGEIVEDAGELTVTASDGYVDSSSGPVPLRTLVVTDDGGNEFAYQAGGVWRVDGERATSVSAPDLDYEREVVDGEEVGRVDINPLSLEGTVGTGEHTIRTADSSTFEFGDDLEYVSHVTIEISGSSYHHGWYDFLKTEFEATDESELAGRDCDVTGQIEENVICHDEARETVTVVATVDGETAFGNLVGVDPTIYGGLYLGGDEGTFNSSLTVDAYDGHDADTAGGTGVFLAEYDAYEFGNGTDIDGIPVVNGTLRSLGDPSIAPIAYGLRVDEGPNGKRFDDAEGGYWLDSARETLATELSTPYDGLDGIDVAIEHLLTSYLEGETTASGNVTAGLYHGVGADDIDSLDSSAGDVHVGVDGNLDLSGVTVAGDNRTSLYVDGDVDLSDVEITPDDRAESLWVYATSDSTVTVDGDFQGVVYAPGADLEIADGVTIDGAVVAGDATQLGDDVRINFDSSLRSATPLTEADQDLLFEYGNTRDPMDVTFVLDRSGSMGPHNPTSWFTYSPRDEIEIGEEWEPIPTDEPFRNTQGESWRETERAVQLRADDGTTRTLERRGVAHPDDWAEIRVHPRDHSPTSEVTAKIGLYDSPGNDPKGLRVDATKNAIDKLSLNAGDRVGVYDFARDGRVLYGLDGNLTEAKKSVVGTADGGTNMAAGLKLALDDYADHGTDDNERVVILLSDGENNDDEDDTAMDEQVARATDLNATLHTVGLDGTGSIPAEKLEGWAAATGGNYYEAEDAGDLLDLFERITEEEIDVEMDTRLEVSVTYDRETTGGHAVQFTDRTVRIDS